MTEEQKFNALLDHRTGIYKDSSRHEYVAIGFTPDPIDLGRCSFVVPDGARKIWEEHVWELLLPPRKLC